MSSNPQEQMIEDAGQEHHPGWRMYAQIAAILTVITAIEVATYYVNIGSMLVWVLLILSALKFGIVIGYYMHLKFDNRLFSYMFLFGVITALCIVVAFLALFDRLW